jgi:hypothetical protein
MFPGEDLDYQMGPRVARESYKAGEGHGDCPVNFK